MYLFIFVKEKIHLKIKFTSTYLLIDTCMTLKLCMEEMRACAGWMKK